MFSGKMRGGSPEHYFTATASDAIESSFKYFSNQKLLGDKARIPASTASLSEKLLFNFESLNAYFKTNFIQRMEDTNLDFDEIAKSAASPLPSIFLTGQFFWNFFL